MAALRTWLRPGAAILLLAGVLGLGCGRGSKQPSGYALVRGTVTYTRLPVVYDATTGVPSPTLGSTGVVTPARQVQVRAFQRFLAPDPNTGALVPTWRLMGTTTTDSAGGYEFSGTVKQGYATFIEVDSVFRQAGGNRSTVQVIADPAGITSATPVSDRPIYVLRQDVANRMFTTADALAEPTAVASLGGDSTVDFRLGNSSADLDTWAVTVPRWYASGSQPVHQTETQSLGSRVLAILDSAYSFSYYYGDPTPSRTPNGFLDLHYYPRANETPRRSFVVHDPRLVQATAFDGEGKLHYFGALAGAPGLDDAFDPGVLYPLFARNNLAGQARTTLFPYGQGTDPALRPDLAPDLAVVEGLGDAMAATLLQTPFLTDLSAATPLASRDIRTVASRGVYSPANLAALAWRLTLTVHGIPDFSEGTRADWVRFDPTFLRRFFLLAYPTEVVATGGGEVLARRDVASIFGQLRVLYDNHTEDPVNLSVVFNDTNLIPLANQFGINWPGAQFWTPFAANWGQDPSGAMPAASLALDPALAAPMPNPDILNPNPATLYLNDSHGEVAYARMALTRDWNFAVSLANALPAGVQVELVADDAYQEAITFSAADPLPKSWYLKGSYDSANPARHFVRLRLLSQDPSLSAPPVAVVVNLARVN